MKWWLPLLTQYKLRSHDTDITLLFHTQKKIILYNILDLEVGCVSAHDNIEPCRVGIGNHMDHEIEKYSSRHNA
jgi:hypothetical protein